MKPRLYTTEPSLKRVTLEQIRQEALGAYDRLPKPLLLQLHHRHRPVAVVVAYVWQ